MPMMKKLLTLALFISVTHAVFCQQVLFKEDFTHMPGLGLSSGWTTSSTGAVGWRTSDMYNLYCSYSVIPQYTYWAKVAAISGCYGDKGGKRNNLDVLAYTKSINLSAVQGGAVLKYDSYFNRMNAYFKYEKATVEVSINNGASWTVLQDVPAGATQDSFTTWYINMSQYVGYGNVKIGFRYSDQGVDHKYGGWAIDNIELFRPEQKDLALEKFSPSDSLLGYAVINNTIAHSGTVLNKGLDTVHSFIIKYKRDNGYELAETYNVTIPPLTRFDFVHNIPDTISKTGKTIITAWVEMPGDANHKNDTIYTSVQGAHFMPKKIVAVEEGTGTWNMFGPRGHVYMKMLNDDNEACLISVHSTDPMDMEAYSDYFYSLNYVSGQFFMLDRKYVEPHVLFTTFARHRRHFGFADLEMHGSAYGNKIDIGVNVKPAIDMKGDFRLILVITEDGVNGTGTGWQQVNGYAGNKMGSMGDYHTRPDPVPATDMKYNFVARSITPAPNGDKAFATELKYGNNYFHKFELKLEEGWDRNKLRAVVMLFRNDDTLVLNSNKLNYFLSVAGGSDEEARTGLYPNPAHLSAHLQFETKGREKADVLVTDINGRRLLHIPVAETNAGINELTIPTANLPTGLYIVNVITATAKHSLKLQVVH